MATVSRKDVTLSEETAECFDVYYDSREVTFWTAELDGLASTGERVSMSRSAEHAGEALLLLTEALKEEGYELQ